MPLGGKERMHSKDNKEGTEKSYLLRGHLQAGRKLQNELVIEEW